ncbi:acyloxyacyl hydrolase [Chryseolinea lacunae]|uniref:Acyloxyacyl hydrolase n=1 Tax=Chryseolinea lacunae TaxID=2801331 RepID=A0ABS1KRT0_9BACT|nr:acyloxyacyl hydrolase [Chryseolinea lacunae]MBL0742055.1 acyloxyacyl hydrolase [Chryseolinea lacunae]
MLLLVALTTSAQTPDSSRIYFVDARFHSGKILIDDPSLATLLTRPPRMAEVNFSLLKNEQRAWDYANCYTKNGVSLSYADFGNTAILGHAVSATVFTEPFIVNAKHIQVSLRCGAGFSYLNKIHNTTANPDNIYYSQHISFLLLINPTLYYAINDRWRVMAGAQISHISNGGSTWPNWGINVASGSVGVEYALQPLLLKPRKRVPFTDRDIKFIAHAFAGRHTSDPTQDAPSEKRFAGGLNLGAAKPLGRVCALGLGAEFYYDGIAQVLEAQSGKKYNPLVGSVSLQNYFFFGKLLFGQQLAYYITPNHPSSAQKFYQVYLLEYKIKGPLYAGVALHARGKISDFLSISTGYIF